MLPVQLCRKRLRHRVNFHGRRKRTAGWHHCRVPPMRLRTFPLRTWRRSQRRSRMIRLRSSSLGNVAEGQKSMQRVLDLPNATNEEPDAKHFLAMVQLDSDDKDPTPSEAEVNEILATDPNYVPALMARADIQLRRGDAKSAATIYSGILQKLPDFAPAQKRLAAIYVEEPANLDRGYELANKARRTLPDDPALATTLGTLSYLRKVH